MTTGSLGHAASQNLDLSRSRGSALVRLGCGGGTDPHRTEGAVGVIALRCQQAERRCQELSPGLTKAQLTAAV